MLYYLFDFAKNEPDFIQITGNTIERDDNSNFKYVLFDTEAHKLYACEFFELSRLVYQFEIANLIVDKDQGRVIRQREISDYCKKSALDIKEARATFNVLKLAGFTVEGWERYANYPYLFISNYSVPPTDTPIIMPKAVGGFKRMLFRRFSSTNRCLSLPHLCESVRLFEGCTFKQVIFEELTSLSPAHFCGATIDHLVFKGGVLNVHSRAFTDFNTKSVIDLTASNMRRLYLKDVSDCVRFRLPIFIHEVSGISLTDLMSRKVNQDTPTFFMYLEDYNFYVMYKNKCQRINIPL